MKKKTILLILVLMFISTNALAQNWIQGQITGDVQAGISVELYKTSCGGDVLIDTYTTNSAGYYGFGCLNDGDYRVSINNNSFINSFIISPEFHDVVIPQTIIQSYDFTVTMPTCDDVDRFLDNEDGTVTDCRTDLVWLKDAYCYGEEYLEWWSAGSAVAVLTDGGCGLTDGSIAGDWRLPTKEELQGIGTDPPTTWWDRNPSVAWTTPGSPFENVIPFFYWSSTEKDTVWKWFVDMGYGYTSDAELFQNYDVWPVKRPGHCTDVDNDGFFAQEGCDNPIADCDDNNAALFPGAEELCDGIDNNCNVSIDETFDLNLDFYNCGQCGYVCSPEMECISGACMDQ
jgi:hypothetical protein